MKDNVIREKSSVDADNMEGNWQSEMIIEVSV